MTPLYNCIERQYTHVYRGVVRFKYKGVYLYSRDRDIDDSISTTVQNSYMGGQTGI